MAFNPITLWQINREIVETVTDFILGGSKITADGDCSQEIKRPLLLGRKVMTNLVAQMLKRLPAMRETWVRSLGREDSPGEGNGNPLQYSCLENPMDGGAWWATVHGVAKSRTGLSNFTFTFRQHIKEQRHYSANKGPPS